MPGHTRFVNTALKSQPQLASKLEDTSSSFHFIEAVLIDLIEH